MRDSLIFFTKHGYARRGINKNIFVKKDKGKVMISQIHVDDIVFGGMSSKMVGHFFFKKFNMNLR